MKYGNERGLLSDARSSVKDDEDEDEGDEEGVAEASDESDSLDDEDLAKTRKVSGQPTRKRRFRSGRIRRNRKDPENHNQRVIYTGREIRNSFRRSQSSA
jgi:hypothetical protein